MLERKAEPSKKKDKAKSDVQQKSGATLPAAESSITGERKTQKKEKKEKKTDASPVEEAGKNKSGKVTTIPAADAGDPVPSMIDLRVGHIVDGVSISQQ